MRLYFLLLLFISVLSQNIGYAGTLVGDWYLEDTEVASIDERRAFSQPIAQSTEAIQVTLGIKSPGVTNLVDFYLVISSKTADSICQYTVNGITIDSRSIPIRSTTHSSDISQFETRSEDEQKRLWRDFRKGQNLTLKIHQACNIQNVQGSDVNKFDFSLKGSSAAYRYVARQKAIDTRNQQDVKTRGLADVEITIEEETSQTMLIPLLAALFIVILIVKLINRHAKKDPMNSIFNPGTQRIDTNTGDRSHSREATDTAAKNFQFTPGTDGAFIPDSEQNIANLPRFKVEYVIDGDTVKVSTFWHKLRIRLDSIDCPEDGQEWGDIATAGLIKLIGGRHVHVEEHGTDRYERTVATLYVQHGNDSVWMNVNERMVTLGHAWVMRKYYKHLSKHRQDKLNKLERWAKSKRVGLWKLPEPIPPWKWRHGS